MQSYCKTVYINTSILSNEFFNNIPEAVLVVEQDVFIIAQVIKQKIQSSIFAPLAQYHIYLCNFCINYFCLRMYVCVSDVRRITSENIRKKLVMYTVLKCDLTIHHYFDGEKIKKSNSSHLLFTGS